MRVWMCVCVCVCVSRVTAGLMLQQRRPDTPVLRARISLTCQIGGSVSLAAGPSLSQEVLSLYLWTWHQKVRGREVRGGGGEIYWPEGERRGINYNIWSDWINIECRIVVLRAAFIRWGVRKLMSYEQQLQRERERESEREQTGRRKLYRRWRYAKYVTGASVTTSPLCLVLFV